MPYPKSLLEVLQETSRPVFLFGSTPPREDTEIEKAKETCRVFTQRSAVLATDGFIVYDIQDEGSRTDIERPFPFRKTMDAALYASLFSAFTNKQCIVYKCVSEGTVEAFDDWLIDAQERLHHSCFTLVGAASSRDMKGIHLGEAAARFKFRKSASFGCVCIPERHTTKGNEHQNMLNKVGHGAEWFISQGIFSAEATIKLINDYGDLCKKNGIVPKKIVMTFAPCGRPKTMTFIKWLGMHVPADVEARIMSAENHVNESILVSNEILTRVLQATGGSGVPLGLNVESLSIFKEEIVGAHDMFQILQETLLNSAGSPWAVRWLYVHPRNIDSSRNGDDSPRIDNTDSVSPSPHPGIHDHKASDQLIVSHHQAKSDASTSASVSSATWLNTPTVVTVVSSVIISFSLGVFIGTRRSFRGI